MKDIYQLIIVNDLNYNEKRNARLENMNWHLDVLLHRYRDSHVQHGDDLALVIAKVECESIRDKASIYAEIADVRVRLVHTDNNPLGA